MRLLLLWLMQATLLYLLAWALPGMALAGFGTALLVAFVLGLVNLGLRPVLMVLTLPANILTLGLFTSVVNGFCLWLVGQLVPGFTLAGFGSALLAALCYNAASWVMRQLLWADRL
jgi:putative membrane protein